MSGNVLGLGDNTVEYDSNYGREVLIGRLSERGKAYILVRVCVRVSNIFPLLELMLLLKTQLNLT